MSWSLKKPSVRDSFEHLTGCFHMQKWCRQGDNQCIYWMCITWFVGSYRPENPVKNMGNISSSTSPVVKRWVVSPLILATQLFLCAGWAAKGGNGCSLEGGWAKHAGDWGGRKHHDHFTLVPWFIFSIAFPFCFRTRNKPGMVGYSSVLQKTWADARHLLKQSFSRNMSTVEQDMHLFGI